MIKVFGWFIIGCFILCSIAIYSIRCLIGLVNVKRRINYRINNNIDN